MEPIIVIFGIIGFFIFFYILTQLRKVVATNEVHIIQKGKNTIAYGKGLEGGNVYLAWPSWVPAFGISVQKLPLSIFDLQLSGYKAYDSGKVPFQVDITAFFLIADPVVAAEKIDTLTELREQLNETLKGVVRKVLASKEIIEIMDSRKEIKEEFYNEVYSAVKAWGMDLKNVEFMDIKDADGSQVITNIMNKKRSLILAESEIEVAENEKNAIIQKENKTAEARAQAARAKAQADIIESDAERESELKKIENEKLTQNQNIEKERILAVQKEEAKQNLYDSEKITKEKELGVKQVEEEKNAQIAKSIEIIRAEEQKAKKVIDAEGEKQKVELEAEAEKNRIEAVGLAKAKEIDYIGTAKAKNKMEMAKALNSFQESSIAYLKKELDAHVSEIVDLEKAKALSNADVKVISTGANGGEGVKNFMDLFSANGGTNIGAMVEAAKSTMGEEKVNAFLQKFTKKTTEDKTSENS